MSPPVRDPRAGQDSAAVPRVIALVGLRGSGKSTVGALLAAQLRRPFVDLDREIERSFAAQNEEPLGDASGVSSTRRATPGAPSAGAILRELGEPRFRELESQALQRVIARGDAAVLACGGGVVVREENRRLLRTQAWVVWLQAPQEELARRLRADPTLRPSLTGGDPIEELALLAAQRHAWYQELAHLVFRTEGLGPEQVARVIGSGLAASALEGPPDTRS